MTSPPAHGNSPGTTYDDLDAAIGPLDAVQLRHLVAYAWGYCPHAVERGLADVARRWPAEVAAASCLSVFGGEPCTVTRAGHRHHYGPDRGAGIRTMWTDVDLAPVADPAEAADPGYLEDAAAQDEADGGCVTMSPAVSACIKAAGHDLIGGTPHRDLNGRRWDDDGWIVPAAALPKPDPSGDPFEPPARLPDCTRDGCRHPEASHMADDEENADGPCLKDFCHCPAYLVPETTVLAAVRPLRGGFIAAPGPVLLGAKVQTGGEL